jgi:hypothetical protein
VVGRPIMALPTSPRFHSISVETAPLKNPVGEPPQDLSGWPSDPGGRARAVASRPIEQLHGIAIPRTLHEACDPRRLALVVYDMQVILRQIADRERVVAQVAGVLEAARAERERTF